MADSRWVPTYPPASGRRSPQMNPARLSMPTVPSGSSPAQYLYSGPVPLMPPGTHPPPHPHQHPHQHQQHYDVPASSRRQASTPQTTTYQVAQDPVTRSSSVRQVGNPPTGRSHRASTMDSNTQRPIIVTTSGSGRSHPPPSSHSSGRVGDRSPTRENYRAPEEQYYSQPASSMRSRSSHRPAYSATLDNDELARLRERGDPRHLEPYRPRGSGGPVYHSSRPPRHPPTNSSSSTAGSAGGGSSSSRKEHKRAAVPDEGYEYYRPSDLARYDLENPREAGGSSRRRRESLDRGSYYRPSVAVNSGYDRTRPPPTTRGLDKMNRPTSVYESPQVRMPVPHVPPAAPAAPPPDASRRTASDSKQKSPPTRRERPASMYHDERAYRHQDPAYYPPHEGSHHRERRDVDREYDRRPFDGGDAYHDESVPSRGFGIRTDDHQYDSTYRRPVHSYVEMPPEPRRPSDEPLDYYDERERDDRARRERRRASEDDDEPRGKPAPKEEEKQGFRKKMAAGVEAAAAAVGLGPSKDDKDGKVIKEEAPPRRGRSPDDDRRVGRRVESQSRERSPSRSRSQSGSRSGSRSRARDRSLDSARAVSREREGREDRNGARTTDYRERNHRTAEDKLNGTSPSSSGQLTPTSDDERRAKPFKPNDPTDLMDIKAQLEELDRKAAGRDDGGRRGSMSPEKRSVDILPHDKSVADEENRGRELVQAPTEKEKQVRVVSPPREKAEAKPLKGILKTPSERFPEDPNPIREGVAPHRDDKTKKDAPPGARWTKIRRDIVNPEALEAGKERFEVRDNFVIVLRVLNKEEIEQYAYATQLIREKRHEERLRKEKGRDDRGYSKDRARSRDDDDKDRRYSKSHRREDDEDDRKYRESKDRDYDRERERRRHRHEKDIEVYDESPRSGDYDSGYPRSHRDRDRDE